MPELPEVETVARQLRPLVCGRRVERLEIVDRAKIAPPPVPLAGRRLSQVLRVGKRVLFGLDTAVPRLDPLWLAVHLRMSGRLIWTRDRALLSGPHVRARLHLEGGAVVFVDPRRFGTFSWLGSTGEADAGAVDPVDSAFTIERLAELVRGSRQALKPWLLRQDRLVGIGNIYASEILWHARLSPFRRAGSLSRPEVARLHAATRAVLSAAIENCGTTFSDFQDAHGLTGAYQGYLAVYEREAGPCPRCGTPVRRRAQGQRSTYWCPACIRREARDARGTPQKKRRPASAAGRDLRS